MQWKKNRNGNFTCGPWTIQPTESFGVQLFFHRVFIRDYKDKRERDRLRRAKQRAHDLSIDCMRALQDQPDNSEPKKKLTPEEFWKEVDKAGPLRAIRMIELQDQVETKD